MYRSAQLLLLERLGGKILVQGGAWRRGFERLGAKLVPARFANR